MGQLLKLRTCILLSMETDFEVQFLKDVMKLLLDSKGC